MAHSPQVARPRFSGLPSETKATLLALARLMAEIEAARIVEKLNDPVGDLRTP